MTSSSSSIKHNLYSCDDGYFKWIFNVAAVVPDAAMALAVTILKSTPSGVARAGADGYHCFPILWHDDGVPDVIFSDYETVVTK